MYSLSIGVESAESCAARFAASPITRNPVASGKNSDLRLISFFFMSFSSFSLEKQVDVRHMSAAVALLPVLTQFRQLESRINLAIAGVIGWRADVDDAA